MLDAIIEGVEDIKNSDKIREIDKRLYELQNDIDYQKAEVEGEIGFEKTCLFVSQEMHKDAKLMSVKEFETAIQILQDRAKENEKRFKK